jgi:hypothetical protein
MLPDGSYQLVTMLPDSNFLIHIVAIYTCGMETTIEKKAARLAALSVGVGIMLIAGFASPTHPSLANAHKALHSRLGSCSTSTLLGVGQYD